MLIHPWFWFFWKRVMKAFQIQRKQPLKFKCEGSRMCTGIFCCCKTDAEFSETSPLGRPTQQAGLWKDPCRVFPEKNQLLDALSIQRNSTQWSSHCPFYILGSGRGGQSRKRAGGDLTGPGAQRGSSGGQSLKSTWWQGLVPPGGGEGDSASCFSLSAPGGSWQFSLFPVF